MSVPNRFDVVQRVYDAGHYDLTSHDGCGQLCEAVVSALHVVDANFGHLKKSPPHNMYNGHAVDAVLYLPAGKTVDFINGSAAPGASIGWRVNEDDHYSAADWYAPVEAPVVVPPVVVPPPSVPPVSSVDLSAVLTAIAALSTKVDAIAVKPVKFPIYRTSLYGYPVILKPDGVS